MKDSAREKCLYIVLTLLVMAVIVFGAVTAAKDARRQQEKLLRTQTADELVTARKAVGYAEALQKAEETQRTDRGISLRRLLSLTSPTLPDGYTDKGEPIMNSDRTVKKSKVLLAAAESKAKTLHLTAEEIKAATNRLHELVEDEEITSASGGAPEAVEEPHYDLELVEWTWSRTYSYATVEGRVKNVSDESIGSVMATASFYTKTDKFITADRALIDYNPILPGQTSPFEVIATYNPAMKGVMVEFSVHMGGALSTKYPAGNH